MGHGPLSCAGRHLNLTDAVIEISPCKVCLHTTLQPQRVYRGRNCTGYRIQLQLGTREVMFKLQTYYARPQILLIVYCKNVWKITSRQLRFITAAQMCLKMFELFGPSFHDTWESWFFLFYVPHDGPSARIDLSLSHCLITCIPQDVQQHELCTT